MFLSAPAFTKKSVSKTAREEGTVDVPGQVFWRNIRKPHLSLQICSVLGACWWWGRGTEPLYQPCTAEHCVLSNLHEAVPYHINIIHMQKERDLVLQKNKCNNFQYDPATFHMNTHIIFLLFSQLFICSRISLLSFGDVSWKLPWNQEVLIGQLTQIKSGSALSHTVAGGDRLAHGTWWFQPAR